MKQSTTRRTYQWCSATLWYIHSSRTGHTTVQHYAVDMACDEVAHLPVLGDGGGGVHRKQKGGSKHAYASSDSKDFV